MLAVALFFFSCEDETSTLGYKNPNSKFKVSYVEIPLESSVVLRDSVRTTNYRYTGDPSRLLVGNYTDEAFGSISTAAFTQYFTNTPQFKVSATAVYDSVTMNLQFDLYHYGATTKTPQTISVYELDEELRIPSFVLNDPNDSSKGQTLVHPLYFNNSTAAHSNVIGSANFTVDPAKFDEFASSADDVDTVITVTVPLNSAFGKRIFDCNARYRDDAGDNVFGIYGKFVKEFKGIAIKPDMSDKVIGFSPSATASRIRIHYHDANEDSLFFDVNFNGVMSFNQITSDRTGTELQEVNEIFKESLIDSDMRYIQSGVGILTKLDFGKFYEFTDTVPYVVINSAELSIESVESSGYAPPSVLSLRVMNENTGRMKKFSNAQDAKDLVAYRSLLRVDQGFQNSPAIVDYDSVLYATDRSLVAVYSNKEKKYSMELSLFLQQMAAPFDDRTKFRSFILHPATETQSTTNPDAQTGLKTVNRAVFPKDKVKLKIFYTKPTASR
jgi:hypothetical protein